MQEEIKGNSNLDFKRDFLHAKSVEDDLSVLELASGSRMHAPLFYSHMDEDVSEFGTEESCSIMEVAFDVKTQKHAEKIQEYLELPMEHERI